MPRMSSDTVRATSRLVDSMRSIDQTVAAESGFRRRGNGQMMSSCVALMLGDVGRSRTECVQRGDDRLLLVGEVVFEFLCEGM